jgi:hypothetical protein
VSCQFEEDGIAEILGENRFSPKLEQERVPGRENDYTVAPRIFLYHQLVEGFTGLIGNAKGYYWRTVPNDY